MGDNRRSSTRKTVLTINTGKQKETKKDNISDHEGDEWFLSEEFENAEQTNGC